MALAKCARCDKLFSKSNSLACDTCLPLEEADRDTVRKYLVAHPDTAAEAVSLATGVNVQCILRMVDEGIVVNTTSMGAVKCGRCGAPAISMAKKLCSKCLDDLNQQLAKQRQQVLSQPRPPARGGTGIRQSLESKRN